MKLLQEGAAFDPDNGLGGLGYILDLDTLGLYGSKIWMLYADVCKNSTRNMVVALRAWQLGLLSEAKLRHAVDHYGEGLDLKEIAAKVQERLPNFRLEAEDVNEEVPV